MTISLRSDDAAMCCDTVSRLGELVPDLEIVHKVWRWSLTLESKIEALTWYFKCTSLCGLDSMGPLHSREFAGLDCTLYESLGMRLDCTRESTPTKDCPLD